MTAQPDSTMKVIYTMQDAQTHTHICLVVNIVERFLTTVSCTCKYMHHTKCDLILSSVLDTLLVCTPGHMIGEHISSSCGWSLASLIYS